MSSLATTVNGIKLPNPFVIGSGPPGTNANVCGKAFDEGWGAVIIKTISLDASKVGTIEDTNGYDFVINTFGLMGEKIWEHFSLFLNFENFTNTRQTRFDTIYTGTVTHPVFRDIYAPLDGIVVNGGIKLKL